MARNSTKYLESVITLSEELNFTRAARKMRISQPTLTRYIAELEEKIGAWLFERDRKNVTLTAAGRAYVKHARLALIYGERAFQAARAATQQADAVLNVGRSPYTDPFLTSILLSVKLPSFPKLKIELSSQYSCDLVDELLVGALDLAIATEPPESRFLTTVKVAESPFYIAMSEQNHLARWPCVKLDALDDRWWIIFERRLHPPVYDAVMQLARKRRVTPARIQHITAPEEAFPFVAQGSCVAFVVKTSALLLARNGVTVRPLAENALTLKTYLVSRMDNRSRAVSELVRAFMTKASSFHKAKQFRLPMPA